MICCLEVQRPLGPTRIELSAETGIADLESLHARTLLSLQGLGAFAHTLRRVNCRTSRKKTTRQVVHLFYSSRAVFKALLPPKYDGIDLLLFTASLYSFFTMRLSPLSHKHAVILLPFLLWSSINALPSNLDSRAGSVDSCLDDEAPILDGATSDKSAGIGVEFESSGVTLSQPGSSKSNTDQAKGKLVGNRKGTNWELTADTTSNIAGSLNAEYILDGTKIKIGTGVASAAAAAVSNDLVRVTANLTHFGHILIISRRFHGIRSRIWPKISSTLTAMPVILGQSQIPKQVVHRVLFSGLYKSQHHYL